jgi:lipid-A-disaccharide synthase
MKIMLSTGELSGDIHGARLVSELKKIDPSITFLGVGGPKMKEQGVSLVADLTSHSTVGILEPIRYIPQIYLGYLKIKKALREEKPDLFIAIDTQGFNMLLLKIARKLGIKALYYIAPQEWLWGSEKGGQKVVNLTDKIITIFPGAYEFYKRLGANTAYVGHPLLDIAKANLKREEFYQKFQIPVHKKILTVFPGSRPQEIKYTFPVLLKAAQRILQSCPQLQLVVSIINPKFELQIKQQIQKIGLKDVIFYSDIQHNLIAYTYLSLTPSGTITLEHALLETPCIVAYKFSRISYMLLNFVASKVRERIKYISLPNQIMGARIIPEFIQDDATPETLVKEAFRILDNEEEYQGFKAKLSMVKAKLGQPGVIKRAAEEVMGLALSH